MNAPAAEPGNVVLVQLEVEGLPRKLKGEQRQLLRRAAAQVRADADLGGGKGEETAKVAAKIADALGGSGARCQVGRGVGTVVKLRPLMPDFVYDRLRSVVSR